MRDPLRSPTDRRSPWRASTRPGSPTWPTAPDPGSTDVTTTIDEVLDLGEGVCQDFAHLMIGSLRSVGIPAAYVSGYLETEPPPGKERLTGVDRTHAWVSVYLGDGN